MTSARAVGIACLALAALAVPAQPAPERPLPAADWAEIRRVVVEQREALVRGDAEAAYAFAAPGIRAAYSDAAAFMAMVRRGYAPLVEARHAELLDGAVIGGEPIQPLRLVMPDGTVLVALYTMQRVRDGWRIAGCLVAPSTVRSA